MGSIPIRSRLNFLAFSYATASPSLDKGVVKILCGYKGMLVAILEHGWREFVEAYFTYLRARNASPLTLKSYYNSVATFARWVKKSCLEVTREDVRRFLQSLTYSAFTKAKFLRELHAFYNFLIDKGFVKQNPCRLVG